MKFSKILAVALLIVSVVCVSLPAKADDAESNPVIKPLAEPAQGDASAKGEASAAIPAPTPKKAEVSNVPPECASITSSDRQNLCIAKSAVKDKSFGYENKDHRNYYCSLIKDRDLQTYCYAVVGKKASSCDLIVDPGVEKECKASF